MEDILEVYKRPYDPKRPLICFDEGLRCLIAEKFAPQPARPGKPRRADYTYEAAGSRKLLLACEPLKGSRVVRVSKRRTKKDWAYFMRDLIEVHYPDAQKIVLVMDNLNTHNPSSFYETFPPEVARRLTEKLEIHYTPKHGSWLNMAEIELSALARSLRRRIATAEELTKEVAAWQKRRNQMTTTISWQFTTADARIKLKHLYPVVQSREGSASSNVTNLS